MTHAIAFCAGVIYTLLVLVACKAAHRARPIAEPSGFDVVEPASIREVVECDQASGLRRAMVERN